MPLENGAVSSTCPDDHCLELAIRGDYGRGQAANQTTLAIKQQWYRDAAQC